MARRIRHNGDEQDAFSRRWRKVMHWQSGELRRIKRRANKRDRRAGKAEARDAAAERWHEQHYQAR